ncbi:helix-turn-helix domain-containing protein [Terribacillus saccharophilus]|uniref:helix-turn-helix domain-containing protein n=1 Tax=Terribacillus saccharophilus TaxID=361277 RepID=UPI002989A262|nr:hypothetical protein [Terribacillus saccharophilus]
MQSGNFSEFIKLAKFTSKDEMDMAIRSFLYNNKHNLTDSEIKILKKCAQLALKAKGVFYTSLRYLADLTDVSSKTVQRALAKFGDLGFIVKMPTIRKRGGKGHNVYVIQEVETVDFENLPSKSTNVQSDVQSDLSNREIPEKPVVSRDEASKNVPDTRISYTKSSKRSKTIVQDVLSATRISKFVSDWVPNRFAEFAEVVFQNPNDIETAWKVIRKPLNNIDSFSFEDKVHIGIECIKALFRKIKSGTAIETSPFAYLSGVNRNIIDKRFEVEEQDSASVLVMPDTQVNNTSSISSGYSYDKSILFYEYMNE